MKTAVVGMGVPATAALAFFIQFFSLSTYVEQEDTREVINITELNAEIKRIVAREQVLRDEIDKIVAEIEGC